MVGGAGSVEKDQAYHKNAKTRQIQKIPAFYGGVDQDERSHKNPHDEADQMGKRASRVFDEKSTASGRGNGGRRGKRYRLFQEKHLLFYLLSLRILSL